jgi:hypothetical protein
MALDPLVLSLINAPLDDESTTEEDLRAIDKATNATAMRIFLQAGATG